MDSRETKKGISPAVLILSVLLTAAVTAVILLALRSPSSTAPTITVDGKAVPSTEVPMVAAFTQKDEVDPGQRYTGQVFYPIPYSSPPSLKLTCEKRVYEVTLQNESGFTWVAQVKLEDVHKDVKDAEALLRSSFAFMAPASLKAGIRFEPFTWEAKGVRGNGVKATFDQTGTFTTLADTDGEVVFPIPYANKANVELSGSSEYVIITECTANGFKWKNKPNPTWKHHANGTVTWKAKGIRAEK